MYLGNVFYGFTQDGVDRLLWKRYKTVATSMGDVTKTIYYDLNSEEELDSSFVDRETLKPITKLVGDFKWMRRKKVKRFYNADRNFLIDVTGAYYGEILNKKIVNNVPKSIVLRKDKLFARIDDAKGRSMEAATGYLYPRAESVLRGVCVREIRPIKTSGFDDVVEPKRKLLELDYRKEL